MKPTLLILAAGMGSRYGGLKQIDKFGPSGESIIDYSIYDAIKAGFKKVVFVVRESFLEDIKAIYEPRLKGKVELVFVTQDISDIPAGISVNPDREKPWGTAHAVLVAKDIIENPFAVINGDDYYGHTAFETLVDFFNMCMDEGVEDEYSMIAYYLKNTLSDHGTVNRGICHSNEGYLDKIVETIKISKSSSDGDGAYELDGKQHSLEPNTLVSMNMFGFFPDFFELTESYFIDFLKTRGMELKSEFFIPYVLDQMIQSNTKKLNVLESDSQWFGVTYQEDKPLVMQKIQDLIASGQYPSSLWS